MQKLAALILVIFCFSPLALGGQVSILEETQSFVEDFPTGSPPTVLTFQPFTGDINDLVEIRLTFRGRFQADITLSATSVITQAVATFIPEPGQSPIVGINSPGFGTLLCNNNDFLNPNFSCPDLPLGPGDVCFWSLIPPSCELNASITTGFSNYTGGPVNITVFHDNTLVQLNTNGTFSASFDQDFVAQEVTLGYVVDPNGGGGGGANCPGDTDQNGVLDIGDLIYIIMNWGVCPL